MSQHKFDNASLNSRQRQPEPGRAQLVVSCRGGLAAAAAGFFFLLALMASSTDPGRAGPGLLSSVLLLLVLAWLSGPVGAVSERGKWIIDIDNKTLKENNLFNFTKTLFSNSSIHLKLVAETCNSSAPFRLNISWYLRNSHCYNEISKINFGLDTFDVKTRLRDHLLQTTTEKTSGLTEEREVVPQSQGLHMKHTQSKAAASAEGRCLQQRAGKLLSSKEELEERTLFILNIRRSKPFLRPGAYTVVYT
ncbi:transmembrane protein 87A-like protein [Lates japonicus]|uniref:Transmembrane protein 87A-like protein n=1 Tax=Lates japonicus TaxID=270547 RepID=A0AAD3NHR5_LATJO|nr:transmembrane protein 87A-like protein [Lates japonicus]